MITLITVAPLGVDQEGALHVGNRPAGDGQALVIGRSGDTTQVEIAVNTIEQAHALCAAASRVRDAIQARDFAATHGWAVR